MLEDRVNVPNTERPTCCWVTGSIGLWRNLTPTKPTPGKNGAEPKIEGSKVQPRLAALLKVCS